MLKVRGFRVAPAQLEGCIIGHPDVEDTCVLGVPDEFSRELPVADDPFLPTDLLSTST